MQKKKKKKAAVIIPKAVPLPDTHLAERAKTVRRKPFCYLMD